MNAIFNSVNDQVNGDCYTVCTLLDSLTKNYASV